MNAEELKKRFKDVSVAVFVALKPLDYTSDYFFIKKQLLRSSSSAAANYRAACRAKSKADFIHKLKIVEEETDESLFWMEFLEALPFGDETLIDLSDSKVEFNQLLSIVVSSIKTLKK